VKFLKSLSTSRFIEIFYTQLSFDEKNKCQLDEKRRWWFDSAQQVVESLPQTGRIATQFFEVLVVFGCSLATETCNFVLILPKFNQKPTFVA
jgi:hypothetical protein